MSYSITRRSLIGLAAISLLSGCGFRLRGSFHAPFETLYLKDIDDNSPFFATLSRYLEAGSNVRVVTNPDEAEATLIVKDIYKNRDILTINVSGRAREYELTLAITFSVTAKDGFEYVPLTTLSTSREISYSESEFLSREKEEEVLYMDMQDDLISQMTRYIEASHTREED